MEPYSLFGGTGFVLGRYSQLHPESIVESRDTLIPRCNDVLYGASTTDNYWPLKGQYRKDVDTNVGHLLDVLPHIKGSFTWLSSWFVYSKGLNHPAREDDPCRPMGSYAISKVAAEMYIESHVQTAMAGLIPGPSSYRILRLCNVIGNDPRASKQKGALEMMLKKVARGEEVELYDGDCFRNVMHVDDVCRAIKTVLIKGDLNTIYNIGYPTSVRMIDLIEHAKGVTGSKSRIKLVPVPRFHQIVQVPDFWMDTTKLRSLGFIPDMDPYQAVDRVLANLEI